MTSFSSSVVEIALINSALVISCGHTHWIARGGHLHGNYCGATILLAPQLFFNGCADTLAASILPELGEAQLDAQSATSAIAEGALRFNFMF